MPHKQKPHPQSPKHPNDTHPPSAQTTKKTPKTNLRASTNRITHSKTLLIYLKLTLTILILETGIMVLIHAFGIHGIWTYFLDSIFLLVVTTPLIYIFVIKPIGHNITAAKEAEEVLRESEQRFRTLVSNIPGAVYRTVCHGQWTVEFLSPAAKDITGYDPWDFINNNVRSRIDIMHPNDRKNVVESAARCIERRESYALEYRIIHADGQIRWVWDRGRGVFAENGELLYIDGVILDITENRKAQQTIRLQGEIVDNIAEGVSLTRTDNAQIVYTNRQFEQMFGYAPDELIGQNVQILNAPCDDKMPAAVRDEIIRTLNETGRWSGEIRNVRKDGTPFWCRVSVTTFNSEDYGQVWISIHEDINDRKKAQDAFHREARRNQLILQTCIDGFCRVALDGRLLEVNPAMVDMTGYSKGELLQMSIQDLDAARTPAEVAVNIDELARTGHARLESRLGRKDAEVLEVDIGAQLCDIDREKFFFAFIRNITELKRMKEHLEEYHEKMIRAERLASLGTLTAMLAHELTQPLTVASLTIENSLDDLKETTSPDILTNGLKECLRQISNATRIVDRFRSFARRSSLKAVDRFRPAEVIDRIVKILARLAARARMTIDLEALDELPHIWCNRSDFEQVLFVLIQNAIQAATPTKPTRLTITGSVADANICLKFSDNCGGIAPENLDNIFDPFFTTKNPDQGTGLGLCIARQILSRYHGNIHVDNHFGNGATFSVILPVQTSLL